MSVQAKGMKDLVDELSALVGGRVEQASIIHNQQVQKRAPAVKKAVP